MSLSITGGRCLLPDDFADTDLSVADGTIAPPAAHARRLDASGLLVLPGIVDLHGDAFERQIAPWARACAIPRCRTWSPAPPSHPRTGW